MLKALLPRIKTILSENYKFSMNISAQDYQTLKANKLDMWLYKYNPSSGDITFDVPDGNKLAKWLDSVLDFGASDPWGVMDINSQTGKPR